LRSKLIDPTIEEHGGRIVQTGGDSLLVAFDSIYGVVRCALQVQQQVPSYDSDRHADRAIRFRRCHRRWYRFTWSCGKYCR
jgi:adenylate cyclase